MEQLIQIEIQPIGNETLPTVDARELWEKLQVKTRFADWIKRRIEEAQLIEGQDVGVFLKFEKNLIGGRPCQEYRLTLDAAKHLAMLERTEIGRSIRQHFIDFEKNARQFFSMLSLRPRSQEESLLDQEARRLGRERLDFLNQAFANAQQLAKNAGLEGNQLLLAAAKAVQKMYGQDPLLLLELELKSVVQGKYVTVSELALDLGGNAREVNKTLATRGYQRSFRDAKGRLQWELTEEGKKYGQYLDTGKRHSDGTPIQQIKWLRGIVEVIRQIIAIRTQ